MDELVEHLLHCCRMMLVLKLMFIHISFINAVRKPGPITGCCIMCKTRLKCFVFIVSSYGHITKKSNYSKLLVAFNNDYRRILKLPSRSSASTMYVVNNIDSLEVLVRKRIFGFMERLNNSDNTIIKCINNSWILRFDIWSPWNDLLLNIYTNIVLS